MYDGEETGQVVADTGAGEQVLLEHNINPRLHRASNLTCQRLLSALPSDLAWRYGYEEDERRRLERELEASERRAT